MMSEPRETKRCPNCGRLYYANERFCTSTIKTCWGGSVLYGVCKTCADAHDAMDIGKDADDETDSTQT